MAEELPAPPARTLFFFQWNEDQTKLLLKFHSYDGPRVGKLERELFALEEDESHKHDTFSISFKKIAGTHHFQWNGPKRSSFFKSIKGFGTFSYTEKGHKVAHEIAPEQVAQYLNSLLRTDLMPMFLTHDGTRTTVKQSSRADSVGLTEYTISEARGGYYNYLGDVYDDQQQSAIFAPIHQQPKSHHARPYNDDIVSASGFSSDYSHALVPYEGYIEARSLFSGDSEVIFSVLAMSILFVIGMVICGIWWLCCAVSGYYLLSKEERKKKNTSKEDYEHDIENQ